MNNETNDSAKTAEQPTAAAPKEEKAWISGTTVAYIVAGTVAVAGLGAAAWAIFRSGKTVEAVVDAAA